MLKKTFFLSLVLAFTFTVGCSNPTKTELNSDQENLSEFQKVLNHYQGQPLKLKAAQFLIDNIGTNCYARLDWVDEDGKAVKYEALDYKNFDEALAAFEKLGEKHKNIH